MHLSPGAFSWTCSAQHANKLVFALKASPVTVSGLGQRLCAPEKNVAEHLVQTMSRWSSSSYKEYIRVDNALIMEAHQHMADTG